VCPFLLHDRFEQLASLIVILCYVTYIGFVPLQEKNLPLKCVHTVFIQIFDFLEIFDTVRSYENFDVRKIEEKLLQ
jgi:hypothetical protein